MLSICVLSVQCQFLQTREPQKTYQRYFGYATCTGHHFRHVGARVDSLLEADYRYSILMAKTSPEDKRQACTPLSILLQSSQDFKKWFKSSRQSLSRQSPRISGTKRHDLIHRRSLEGNVPICIWAPSNWIVSKKGNPVRPEHVESILGISYLVCLVLRNADENFGAMVEQGSLRVMEVKSQRANSTLYFVELLLEPNELCGYCEGCQYGNWKVLHG